MRIIYLDYNATTPVAPSVFEAMTPFLTEHYGNPSSAYGLGHACREAIEDARGRVAVLLGADGGPVRRPNILWITCEDTSTVFGYCGDTAAVTPNLDRLAAEGFHYTRAFSVGCVCTPARSTLITGMYASSLGSQHLRGPITLPEGFRCYPQYLREYQPRWN